MQFLRHYCMDQVQRVSFMISGLIATPLQKLNGIRIKLKKIYFFNDSYH